MAGSNFNTGSGGSQTNVSAQFPTPQPSGNTPAEKMFYQSIEVLQTELANFGYRAIQAADVRANYLKTIKSAAEEFVELVKKGRITPEEGAWRANNLRNVILQMSRGKDSEVGRAIAEFFKEKGKTLDELLEKKTG